MQEHQDQCLGRRRLSLDVRIGLGREELDDFSNAGSGIAEARVQRKRFFQIGSELFGGGFRRRRSHSLVFSQGQEEIAEPSERPKGHAKKESQPTPYRAVEKPLKERRIDGAAVAAVPTELWPFEVQTRGGKKQQWFVEKNKGKKNSHRETRPTEQDCEVLVSVCLSVCVSVCLDRIAEVEFTDYRTANATKGNSTNLGLVRYEDFFRLSIDASDTARSDTMPQQAFCRTWRELPLLLFGGIVALLYRRLVLKGS